MSTHTINEKDAPEGCVAVLAEYPFSKGCRQGNEMKDPKYTDKEALREWSQMQLERVDITADALANLLVEAWKAGKKVGFKEGEMSNHEFTHFVE